MAEKKQAEQTPEATTNTGNYQNYLLPDFQGSGVDVAVKARSPQEAITKAEKKLNKSDEGVK